MEERRLYDLVSANHPDLLPYLRANPDQAAHQDASGYGLLHAASSYRYPDLVRTLVREFKVPVDQRDNEGDTALHVVETVEVARVLIEELGLDDSLKNADGMTALQKFESEEEPDEDRDADVVPYLKNREAFNRNNGSSAAAATTTVNGNGTHAVNGDTSLPPVPEGLSVTMGTMAEPAADEPEPELRRLVRELGERMDIQSPEGQVELRRLVENAVLGQNIVGGDRNVRQRQD